MISPHCSESSPFKANAHVPTPEVDLVLGGRLRDSLPMLLKWLVPKMGCVSYVEKSVP